jgi:hypothetical protein
MPKRHFSVPMALIVITGISDTSFADDATPQFEKAPGAIVSGLSGLISGTSQALTLDRSNDRIHLIRSELTSQLLEAGPSATKVTLSKLLSNDQNNANNDYRLSSAAVLCNSRGLHTVIAADASYIDTVTSTLNKFATPPKIQTIGDALSTVFQSYSIGAPAGKNKQETAAAVIRQCKEDFNKWPEVAYGRQLHKTPAEELVVPVNPIDALDTGLSSVATLYNAIVTMLTPIITAPAKEFDAHERSTAITDFFGKYRTTILNAAQSLAVGGSSFASATRLEALGQFSEKMAILRGTSIDLSKTNACKIALVSPLLRTSQRLENGQPSGPISYIPNDNFVVCYAEAWKQISDAVSAVLVAADQYDKLADASDDALQDAVKKIKDNVSHLNDPDGPQLNDLLDGAAKLIAYGQTVAQALSPDSRDKAQKAINDLMQLVGTK